MGKGTGQDEALQTTGICVRTPTRCFDGDDKTENFYRFRDEYVNTIYVDDAETLHDVVGFIRSVDPNLISLDLETASKSGRFGEWEGSIRTFQIGLDEPERGITPIQFVIDAHAVDTEPLNPLLRNSKIEKQIHYANFEWGWIRLHTGIEMKNVFDSCIANRVIQAHLAKLDPEEQQKIFPGYEKHANGLKDCLESHLNITIPKEGQGSDWSRPRLTKGQVVYAAVDVATLPPLVESQKQMIAKLGAEKDLKDKIDSARRRKMAHIRYQVDKNSDDTERIIRTMNRARTLDELDRIMEASRQMTIIAANRERFDKTYEQLRETLRF